MCIRDRASTEDRNEIANDVIKNNGTKEEFIKLLEDVHTKYLMLADND